MKTVKIKKIFLPLCAGVFIKIGKMEKLLKEVKNLNPENVNIVEKEKELVRRYGFERYITQTNMAIFDLEYDIVQRYCMVVNKMYALRKSSRM